VSATPQPPVPLGAIRQALRVLEAASSERAAAAVVGMSQAGLRKFLAGSKPQQKTREKLETWFREQVARGGFLDRETANAALALLVSTLPEKERARMREQLRETLRSGHVAAGREVPDWLRADAGVGTGAPGDYLEGDAYTPTQGKPMKKRAQTRPRERDANLTAFRVVQEATADDEDDPPPERPQKDPAAVALGLRGGAKGGHTRAANLTAEERSASARKAAAARWKGQKE
jgi:hypothetical protein